MLIGAGVNVRVIETFREAFPQAEAFHMSGKKEVENRDLWELLIAHTHKHSISWHKVKGHSDNAYNNRCDELARGAIAGCKAKQNGVK